MYINDPVYGFIEIHSALFKKIIGHPYFQRLGRIRQLGMGAFVYPGAVHTRASHSLGAFHLMKRALDGLAARGHFMFNAECEGALAAILIHDLGHSPYSHVLEQTLIHDATHEDLTLAMMQRIDRELQGELGLAVKIFKNEYPKHFLHDLVSSQLDVDRLDYLCRDSFYCGVREGNIGAARLLQMLDLHDDRLAVNFKGLGSVENYLMSRRLMYGQVYLHKTVVAAEEVLRSALRRARHLAAEGRRLPCSPALEYFLYGRRTLNDETLAWFALLDDSDILSALKAWSTSDDKVLSMLASAFVNRRLFRVDVYEEAVSADLLDAHVAETARVLDLSRDEAAYFVTSRTVGKEMYDARTEGIGILCADGTIRDVSDLSLLIDREKAARRDCKHYVFRPRL